EEEVKGHIHRVSGRPVVTQMGSMVAGIRALGGKRIALATPYIDEMNDLMEAYLRALGFRIDVVVGLGLGGNAFGQMRALPPEATVELGRRTIKQAPNADVLVISCG